MRQINPLSIGKQEVKHLHRFSEEEFSLMKDTHLDILQQIALKEEQLNAYKKTLMGEIKGLKSDAKGIFLQLRDTYFNDFITKARTAGYVVFSS